MSELLQSPAGLLLEHLLRLYLYFGLLPFVVALGAGALVAARQRSRSARAGAAATEDPDPLLAQRGRRRDELTLPSAIDSGGTPPQKGYSITA